jgi:hypothetical protein
MLRNDLFCLPVATRPIVTTRNANKNLVVHQKGRDHLGELGVNGRIILKSIVMK